MRIFLLAMRMRIRGGQETAATQIEAPPAESGKTAAPLRGAVRYEIGKSTGQDEDMSTSTKLESGEHAELIRR